MSEFDEFGRFADGLICRDARDEDRQAIWRILEPMVAAGETYALPRDWSADQALGYWFQPSHQVRVADLRGDIVGTYYLMANQLGGGDHVSNCGFVTAALQAGRGIANFMCRDAMALAKSRGFGAMQFNFVVETNKRAIALWERLGFKEIGRIPQAFRHPSRGFVGALVMWRSLDDISIEQEQG